MSHPDVDETTKNKVWALVEEGSVLAGRETDTSKVVDQIKHAIAARGPRAQETHAQPRASIPGKRAREAAVAIGDLGIAIA